MTGDDALRLQAGSMVQPACVDGRIHGAQYASPVSARRDSHPIDVKSGCGIGSFGAGVWSFDRVGFPGHHRLPRQVSRVGLVIVPVQGHPGTGFEDAAFLHG